VVKMPLHAVGYLSGPADRRLPRPCFSFVFVDRSIYQPCVLCHRYTSYRPLAWLALVTLPPTYTALWALFNNGATTPSLYLPSVLITLFPHFHATPLLLSWFLLFRPSPLGRPPLGCRWHSANEGPLVSRAACAHQVRSMGACGSVRSPTRIALAGVIM